MNSDKENLVAIKARLKSYHVRPDIREDREQNFMVMEIRNYSSTATMLTAASVNVTGSDVARKGRAGWLDAVRSPPIKMPIHQ